MNTKLKGAMGEQFAARHLREKGYNICSANYSYGTGEIDIIAEKKKVICFVEVKTRTQGGMYAPADAVDYKKQENIKSSAAAYINSFSIKNKIRYDIVEVILSDNNDLVSINHIENAF